MNSPASSVTLASALARLASLSIVFGSIDSNEDFAKDGGWINGTLKIDDVTISIGGGWILSEEGANHWNNCNGCSYSGGGPNPYHDAKSAGSFEAYEGDEFGDVDEVMEALGLTPSLFVDEDGDEDSDKYDEAREAIAEKLREMNEKAWEDWQPEGKERVAYCTLANSPAEIIANLREAIDDHDEDEAEHWAEVAKRKGLSAKVEEVDEDLDQELDPTDTEKRWSTVSRKLVLTGEGLADKGETVAEWTVAAVGFYSDGRNNPNYSHGWNVEEDTDGGDGVGSELRAVLEVFRLEDEATELPQVNEPESAEECDEADASFAVEVRNTYTQGMEDWEKRAFFADHESAEKWESAFWRDFRAANGANAYGPETRIVERDGDEWSAAEGEE